MELQFPISLVIFVSVLFFFLSKLIQYPKRSKSLAINGKLPPEPWKIPLVGHVHHLAGALPHLALRDLARKHGPIVHLKLGEVSTVVISSRDLAKEVMKTHDLAFADRPWFLNSEIIGYKSTNISFSPYGDYWRQMRKICTLELLSAKKVRSFRSIREEECWNLVESIRSYSGTTLDLSRKIFMTVNTIMCRAVFGDRCKDQEALVALLKESVSAAGGFDLSSLFPSIKVLRVLTGKRSKLLKIHKKLDQILSRIVSDHQERRARETSFNREQEDLVGVLTRLKNDGGLDFPITSDNVKAVILTMFGAGTDTSSVTIEWAMSELMRNPRVMEKVQAELRQALKGKERIHESDIEELSYLKLVVKETLRLHPPLPLLLPRECRELCEIGGYNVAVKTKVVVNFWAIARDPDYWVDAESFIPERFSDSSISMTVTDFEYLPFGAGRRMCPAQLLGLANIELSLAHLLYHFDWKLHCGTGSSGDLDMSEIGGATVGRKNHLLLVPVSYDTS